MTKTSKLQAEAEEKETQLLELQDKQRQSKEQIGALEAERRGLVVSARVHKSADAQKAIDRIAAKIGKIQEEDILNGEAFTQVSGQLEATKAELRCEQWRERCDPLRHRLKSRATGELEQEALELALKLRAKLAEIWNSDAAIITELQRIHPLLAPHADTLRSVGERRSGIISYRLEPLLENPFSRAWKENIGGDPARDVANVFGKALQTLDTVAEMEPEGQLA